MSFDGLMKVVRNMNMELRRELQQELEKQLGPLRSTTVAVPKESQALTVDELQEKGGHIVYYYSPRSSVMHFSHQNQSYTFCRRKTEKMQVGHALPREAKVCQQCQGRYKEIRG